MPKLHLAQFNIGRMRGALDGPVMSGFVSRLDEVNALADGSPGFVDRLVGLRALPGRLSLGPESGRRFLDTLQKIPQPLHPQRGRPR